MMIRLVGISQPLKISSLEYADILMLYMLPMQSIFD